MAESKKIGTLQVEVTRGFTLVNRDSGVLGDVSDPCTVVRLGSTSHKTPTIKNNLNPTWSKDNKFSIDVTSLDDIVEFEVMDTDNVVSGDKTLGKTTLALKTLSKGKWEEKRQKLEAPETPNNTGELEFKVKLDMVGLGIKLDLMVNPSAEAEQIRKMIEAASDKAPEKFRPYIIKAAPILAQVAVGVMVAMPYIVYACSAAERLFNKLPTELIYATVGFIMCFFGGVFPATIAAVEAWSACGGKQAIEAVKKLYHEYLVVMKESKADDLKDDDGDGIPDVKQIAGKQLLLRKGLVAMKATDPASVNDAMSCIFTGWMGVVAVLKIKFARTVTLGNVIGKNLHTAVLNFGVQAALGKLMPDEYKQWVPITIEWICKVVAVSIAWWIERIISAVHSAIRGGLMFSRMLLKYLHESGKVNFPDADASYLDEAIGWGIALVGFICQFMFGFSVPFPLSIVFIPVRAVETFIVWSVST